MSDILYGERVLTDSLFVINGKEIRPADINFTIDGREIDKEKCTEILVGKNGYALLCYDDFRISPCGKEVATRKVSGHVRAEIA